MIDKKKLVEAAEGLVNDMQPKPGWNMPSSSIGAAVELIELKDGRTAQVQITIETDDENFWSYYEYKK